MTINQARELFAIQTQTAFHDAATRLAAARAAFESGADCDELINDATAAIEQAYRYQLMAL